MTIEERLEKMEKKLRRSNMLLVGVVLLAVLAITLGAASHKQVIAASAFNLVDENGKIRAALGMRNEVPGVRLFDENGRTRASLAADNNGASLALIDENNNPRACLVVFKDGPGLMLFDVDKKLRAILGRTRIAKPNGEAISFPESSVLLFGADGTMLWGAPP